MEVTLRCQVLGAGVLGAVPGAWHLVQSPI